MKWTFVLYLITLILNVIGQMVLNERLGRFLMGTAITVLTVFTFVYFNTFS